MRREIKKRGDSVIITIPPEEMRGHDLKIGDFVDVTITKPQDTLPEHSTYCTNCKKLITGNSWTDLNREYDTHRKRCKKRLRK